MVCYEKDRTPSSSTVLTGCIFTAMTTMFCIINVMLVYLLIKDKKYKRTYHLAYLNLAVADCLFAAFGATIRGPGIVWGFQSEMHCKLSTYLSYIITYTNLLAVIPITVDRLVAVILPTKYEDTVHFRIVQGGIAASWILSSVYLCVMLITAKVVDEPWIIYQVECSMDCVIARWRYKHHFAVAGILVFMVTPLVINLVGYSLIIRRLNCDKYRRSRNNLIILIRAILICVIFTLSWVPSVIITDILKRDNDIDLWILGKFFFYINCLSDPILYTFSNNVISRCLDRCLNQVTPVKPCTDTTTRPTTVHVLSVNALTPGDNSSPGRLSSPPHINNDSAL